MSTERPRGRARVRIGRIVASAAVAVALLACLAVAVGYITGEWRVQPVPTGSMAPAIPAGAAIVAQPVPVTDLTVGDVIVFRAPVADQRLTVHRVVKIEEQDGTKLVTTQGDANDAADPWRIRLHRDEVYRVNYVIPHAGSAVTWLRNPLFRLATILTGGALILFTGLRAIWRRPGSGDPSEPQDPPDPAAPPVPGVTASDDASATTASGLLNAPSPRACTWTSTTLITFTGANNSPTFTTGYELDTSATSGGSRVRKVIGPLP